MGFPPPRKPVFHFSPHLPPPGSPPPSISGRPGPEPPSPTAEVPRGPQPSLPTTRTPHGHPPVALPPQPSPPSPQPLVSPGFIWTTRYSNGAFWRKPLHRAVTGHQYRSTRSAPVWMSGSGAARWIVPLPRFGSIVSQHRTLRLRDTIATMNRDRVLICPNAFRGSVTAQQASHAMERGIRDVDSDAHIRLLPLADGGDGTAEVLGQALNGQRMHIRVIDAWGKPKDATWVRLPDGTAVIDVSATSGLGAQRPTASEALLATSQGLGQAILAAVTAGCRRIWVALGGSATTDGGSGCLSALGLRCIANDGRSVIPTGAKNLGGMMALDLQPLRALQGVEFTALVDVQAPLLGPTGAATSFGPQKGADSATVADMERALRHWAQLLERATGRPAHALPGAGAAGGLGFALCSAFGARIVPGGAFIADVLGLKQAMGSAQLVFTGEGRVDHQTTLGKVPSVVCSYAAQASVASICLTGDLGEGWEDLLRLGCTAVLPIAPGPTALPDALASTANDLRRTAAAVFRVWKHGSP